jgi:uncharacterized protein
VAVAWWARLAGQPQGWPVAGALLVAPCDVDRHGVAAEIAPFAPAPQSVLPFPSVLVGSRDDCWMDFDRARALASAWGSRFVDAGHQGHINAASGVGDWREGKLLLNSLIDGDPAPAGRDWANVMAELRAAP